MSFTLGRASFTGDISELSSSGDALNLSFDILPASLAVAKVQRQQVLGLGSDDEPVVPFTWSADSDYDGFYTVGSVSVDPVQTYQSNFLMRCRVSLVRVGGGYARPNIETVVSSVVRTNGVGITATEAEGIVGFRPYDAVQYGNPSGGSLIDVRDAEDGDIYPVIAEAPFALDISTTSLAPSAFYNNAAQIEVKVSGTWYPVTGDQVPGNMAGAWRISNGLVRFTASATNVGDLIVELWDTSAWVTMATELRYGQHATGTFSQANSEGGFATGYDQENSSLEWVEPHIIRNDRDTVVLGFRRSSGYSQTFTLRAGDRFCEFRSAVASGHYHAIAARSAWAASGMGTTGGFTSDPGVVADANDGNGHKLALMMTDGTGPYTVDPTGNAGVGVNAAAKYASFGIGCVYDGSTAASNDAALKLAEQYVAAKSWKSMVVAR